MQDENLWQSSTNLRTGELQLQCHRICYALIVSLQNSSGEAVNPNVTVFWNRDFKEIIKVKQGHKSEALLKRDMCVYKRRGRRVSLSPCVHGAMAMWGHRERQSCASEERGLISNQPCWHLDLWLPDSRTLRK